MKFFIANLSIIDCDSINANVCHYRDITEREADAVIFLMKLGRNVSDRAFGTFVNFLDYKLRWLGKELIKVDKYFPSSKTCSDCGYINKNLELNDRD